MILIDYIFYQKWTLVPWNIVLYNVLSGHGPDLYGVEPWYFYVLNGFLNFNVAFILALLSGPVLIVGRLLKVVTPTSIHWKLAIFYTWLSIFTLQPHKEERFLYVIYPALCFNASVCANILYRILSKFSKVHKFKRFFLSVIITLIIYLDTPFHPDSDMCYDISNSLRF